MKFISSTTSSYDPAFSIQDSGTAGTNAFQQIQFGDLTSPYSDFDISSTAVNPNFRETFYLTDNDSIAIEKMRYEKNKHRYLEQFENKYIALLDEEVLDSDYDYSELSKRLYDKIGYQSLFITLVSKNEKTHRLSPKFKAPKSK